ncbi:hypothetical protein MJO28_006356 [Puccinia striiformis f. sp. tritici]|uniref:Uncharacterized protein n=1 Tax=Puccinia striiformis f. sp. tritici TaxID=168172 RepID=A0ACC0EHZ1_9BASI|nr:hypothetical protein MJO28_006356 [Puccinia striiformis f. sp. tritici]
MALLLPHRRLVLLAVCFSEATRCIGINDEWLTCREVEKESPLLSTVFPNLASPMESEMICTPTNVEPVTEVNDAPTSGEEKAIPKDAPVRQTRGQLTGTNLRLEKPKGSTTIEIKSMQADLASLRKTLAKCSSEVQGLQVEPAETKEKLMKNVEELNEIHKLMLCNYIRSQILMLSGKGSTMTDISPKDSLPQSIHTGFSKKKQDPYISELHGDLLEDFKDRLSNQFVERLNFLLHDIASFGINKKIDQEDSVNQIKLNLQRIVLQTIHLMYKHDLVNREVFRHFFEINNTLEISAINLILTFHIKMGFRRHSFYHNNQVVLNNPHSSHTTTMFQGLDSREQRLFLYLCLKLHFTYHYKELVENEEYWVDGNSSHEIGILLNSIFQDASFFNALEDHLKFTLLSRWKQDEFKRLNPEFMKMKAKAQKLTEYLIKIHSNTAPWDKPEVSKILFLILDFVEEFYRGVLDADKLKPVFQWNFQAMFTKLQWFG